MRHQGSNRKIGDRMRSMEPIYRKLYELFNWENRDRKYYATFSDGRQWELTDVYADQDQGMPSHATAEIVRVIEPAEELLRGRAVFFYLSEIAAVIDPETGTVLYETGGGIACPCCGYLTLGERGGFEICPVCYWEDDGQSEIDADQVRGGPNRELSLTQARANYREYGAISPKLVRFVRKPTPEECGR
jgi:hypothetical protein